MQSALGETTRTRFPADDSIQCVWMLAGVVDYKLCDREFDCEHCPFDIAIHERAGIKAQASGRTQATESKSKESKSNSANVDGSELRASFFYHPAHVWASVEEAGNVRAGLDDFAQQIIERAYLIELPEEGANVTGGEVCWRVAHKNGEAGLVAPISGKVRQINAKLLESPSLINRAPYREGWAFVVEPAHLEECLKSLFYGEAAQAFLEREVNKLIQKISELSNGALAGLIQTLAGGARISDCITKLTACQKRQLIDSFLASCALSVGLTRDGLIKSNQFGRR